jgi:endothelin-converting enzyme/putative endopeptidase
MKKLSAAAVACAALLANAADPETPLHKLPYTPGLDVTAMDRTADPCTDFYKFSCGSWLQANPIPPDQSSWDVYRKIGVENQRFLWGILEELAGKTSGRTAVQQKLGDYFAACMNEEAVEKLGAQPLEPYFRLIDGMKSKRDLPAVLAKLHLDSGSSGLAFGFGSGQDYANSTQVIAFAGHGGIALPTATTT